MTETSDFTSPISRWKPVAGHIMTPWAEQVDPHNVLPDYPRPQLTRPQWQNLNGLWEYAVQPKEQAQPETYQGQILVPFAIESALSGVKRQLQPQERLWYRRQFTVPESWAGQRLLLHFGAVDWEAQVWVNGKLAGSHQGGYTPFSFEITSLLEDAAQPQELLVSVWDPSDAHWQERGKQTLDPRQIFYTSVSGIWQTVWLEPVPQTYIRSLRITPDIDQQTVEVNVEAPFVQEGVYAYLKISQDGEPVTQSQAPLNHPWQLSLPDPLLWSPDHPYLYDLEACLKTEAGETLDQVGSYFGMRKFSLLRDDAGVLRLALNNQPLFQYGPLDQGYFPDGLYTAPTDEALKADIEYCKKIGMNMIRKHIKVEPARWYAHCDRLGMIVWQDMPNGGSRKHISLLAGFVGFYLKRNLPDDRFYAWYGRKSEASRQNYYRELKEMLDTLYNTPCVGVWVPFNEAWGQFNARAAGEYVKEYDPTRLVDAASGWFDQKSGDIHSIHVYVGPDMPATEENRASALSEFGGVGLKYAGHVWDDKNAFAYEMVSSPETLWRKYSKMMEALKPMVKKGLSAAIYTETCDVEWEINGYLTYDRRIEKMDAEALRKIHRMLIVMGSA